MSLTEKQIQEAEDYLDGKLDNATKASFESELRDNSDLQDYITLNKQMRLNYSDEDWSFIEDTDNKDIDKLEGYLKSQDAKHIKSTIKSVGKNYNSTVKSLPAKKRIFPYMAIAASILLLVGYFFFFNTPSASDLYAQNNNWNELPSLVSRSDTNPNVLSKGEIAFKNKDYKLAEEMFGDYINNEKELNVNALLYLGVSQLELDNHNKALENFQKIITSNSIDQSKGYWYKALVYLKMDNKENAIKTLELILKSPENYNYKKAGELLSELQ